MRSSIGSSLRSAPFLEAVLRREQGVLRLSGNPSQSLKKDRRSFPRRPGGVLSQQFMKMGPSHVSQSVSPCRKGSRLPEGYLATWKELSLTTVPQKKEAAPWSLARICAPSLRVATVTCLIQDGGGPVRFDTGSVSALYTVSQ